MLDHNTTFLILLGAIVASQVINRRAQSTLAPEQKLALMEANPKVPWTLIFIGVTYGVNAWVNAHFGRSASTFGAFTIVMVGALLVSYVAMIRRYRRLGLPPSFTRPFMIAQSVLLVAVGMMLWSTFATIKEIDATTQGVLNGER